MPDSTAAAPISARRTCASESATSSSPWATCSRRHSWLAIDPVGAKSASSCPSSSATRCSSRRTVGSSPKTSSPTGASAMARRIAAVGWVRVSESRSTCTDGALGGIRSVLGQHLGDQEGQLEALLVVQPRVADRLVALVEVGVEDLLGATEALGDVVAGQLDVDAPGHGAEALVHLEEAAHLLHDVLEVAGLVAAGGLE